MSTRPKSNPRLQRLSAPPLVTSAQTPCLRVLVAEGDHDVRSVLVSLLASEGFDVIEVAHGAAMRDALRATSLMDGPARAPDLLIVDVGTPDGEGLELLAALDENPESRRPPLILLTPFRDESAREVASRLSPAAVFEKPLDLAQLVLAARVVIGAAKLPPLALVM
jgi:DNA-binding response OmpR family regulator